MRKLKVLYLKKFLVPSIIGTMKTRDKIIAYIETHGQVSGKELADFLEITDRAVRKQLATLIKEKILTKRGRPPQVFYAIGRVQSSLSEDTVDEQIRKILGQNFLYVTSEGERIEGVDGFVQWCKKRNFNVVQKSEEYRDVYTKYQKCKKSGLISGKEKIIDTFGGDTCLEDVYYADFYAWEIFGKTKLGQLLLYAKQSQDKKLMKEVVQHIKSPLLDLLENQKINAVGFIPPTVKREVQFMKVFKEYLALDIPEITIQKIRTEIVTPQKTLSKLADRIDNASATMVVVDKKAHGRVLLIDDAVGSGATLNQVACSIKKIATDTKMYGFAITGSAKGFDVISEV